MLSQGQVGPISSTADGVQVALRAGKLGDQIISELHPRYYETAYRKAMFHSFHQAVALSVAGTAMTGAILWNGSSTNNLVLTKVNAMVTVTSATLTGIAIARLSGQVSAPTTTTAATASANNFIGGTAPSATAYNIGTVIGTPTAMFPLMHNTAAIGATGVDSVTVDYEGSIIIPPQSLVCLVALGAASAAAALTAGFMWEEVAI